MVEGVMMRRAERMAVAVRREDGEIVVWEQVTPPFLTRHKWLNIPVIRGLAAAVESMSLGYQALSYSANVHLEAQGQKKVSGVAMGFTFAGSFVIALALLILIPNLIAASLSGVLKEGRMLALVDGLVRIIIVFGYIAGVAMLPQMRRYFEYHGAEHRTVAAFEAGVELTVENVQKFSSCHPRCGTNLVGLVVLMKFLLLPLFGWGALGQRLLARLLALPVVVGVSVEAMKAGGRFPNSKPLQWLLAPGMWLQHITALKPTDAQVEVAIKALKAATQPQVETPEALHSAVPAADSGLP